LALYKTTDRISINKTTNSKEFFYYSAHDDIDIRTWAMNKDIERKLQVTEMGFWRCLRKTLQDKIQNGITWGRF
jgi:hypothetical protein